MTFHPTLARIAWHTGAAIAVFLATAPGAMATCTEPADPGVDSRTCAEAVPDCVVNPEQCEEVTPVNVFRFALYPELYTPAGSTNLSPDE
jgi:hypothetical protein